MSSSPSAETLEIRRILAIALALQKEFIQKNKKNQSKKDK